MRKLSILIGIGAIGMATSAVAHDTETGFASRGACESASADMSKFDRSWLPAAFPDIFATNGEVASFLGKAWSCDVNAADGQWYITDHRQQVLDSDWWAQRKQ